MSRPLVLAGLIAVIAAIFAVHFSTQRAGAAVPPASPLTQTFTGNVVSKIGPNNPGVARPVSITTKSVAGLGSSGGFNGFISEVVVTSTAGSPSEGDVRLNTAVTASSWSRLTAVRSKFQLLAPSAASAEVYTKGAWRPLRRDTQKDTVVAHFVGDGGRLQISISGLVHNGTTNVAVEIRSATANDAGFGFGNISTLDAMPLAIGSNPANGAVAPTNVTPSFLMSENVTGASSAFSLTCNNVPVPANLVGLNTDTIGLDPVADLTPGASCTATVNMAQITDSDSADPPQNGVGAEQFSFTVDLPPSVISATPLELAATDANVVFTFSEPVLMLANAFTLNCGASNLAFLLTTNAQKTVATLNPLLDLPGGATCTATVLANKVTDFDTADPLDNMVSDYVHTFGTDAAPFVTNMVIGDQQSTQGPPTPTWHFELGTQNSTDASIAIDFSEAVNLANGAVVIQCNGQQWLVSTAALETNSVTITPVGTPWPAGSYCSGTIFGTLVADDDLVDPPNNMAQDVTFNFGTDAAPVVVSGSAAGNPPLITVVFNEPVSVLMHTMVCNSVPVIPVANSIDGGTTWTFDNTSNSSVFAEGGQTCVFTIPAGAAVDSDFADPPDGTTSDYVLNIDTDDPPVVTSVTVSPDGTECIGAVAPPLSNGCALGDPVTSTTPAFTVNFSEPVNVASTAAAYSLSCTPSGGSLSGGTGSNLTTTTVSATGVLPGAACTFTVLAAGIADSDLNDPPNNPLANFPFTFEVDAAPAVTAIAQVSGTVLPDNSDTVEITFSEPINISLVPLRSCAAQRIGSSTSPRSTVSSGRLLTQRWLQRPWRHLHADHPGREHLRPRFHRRAQQPGRGPDR